MSAAPHPAKILMTTDAVGGVWRYSIDLANELISRGVDVLLASLGPGPSAEQKNTMGRLPQHRLVAREYALEWMQNPWEDVERSKEWLLQLAREFQPDILHLNGYALADARWDAPTLVVAHSCVRSWWRAVHDSIPPQPEWTEYECRVRAGLRAAGSLVAPSQFMADAMIREYGIERERIRVIYNFSLKKQIPAGTKKPALLAAGRMWDKAKNLALLEAIRPQLAWPLIIAGGQLSREDLDREMASAAIFLHPALYEPFGLAVLEAAQARCALVLADIPSLRELWNGAAVFCNPRDENAWLGEVNHLMNDVSERERLGEAAARRAENFDADRSVREYLDVYANLCREPLSV